MYKSQFSFSIILILAVFVLTTFNAKAQLFNDEPCDAISLNVYSSCFSEYYTVINSSLTLPAQAPVPTCGSYSGSDGDVWFKFVMPPSGSIQIDLDGINIDMIYDEANDLGLALYSGPNCSNLSQAKCSYSIFGPPSVSASGTPGVTYWLRVWYFDGISTGPGMFEVCMNGGTGATPVPVAPPVPNCSVNPAPSDICSSAPVISNLDGYCGSTNNYTAGPSYEPSSGNDLFCGTIEKSSWLAFVAADTVSTFWVYLGGCSGNFQARIYETPDCQSFIPVSNCLETTNSPSYLFASGLTPGNTYYIYMDGYAGSSCNYAIAANTGVAVNCSADSTTVQNTTCNASEVGITVNSFSTQSGCDSVVTTITTLLTGAGDTTFLNATSCNPIDTGILIINMQNVLGCDSVIVYNVSLDPAASFNISANITDASCLNNPDGQIDLSTSGSGLSYLWSNGSTQQDLQNVLTGTYTVTVSGGTGCVDSASFYVSSPGSLFIFDNVGNVSCPGGNDGFIDLGFQPAYGFNWSNGDTTTSLSGIVAGDYFLTITDLNGCKYYYDYSVTEPAAPNISAQITPSGTSAIPNGEIDLTVTGGTTPFSYLWSNAATTQDLSALVAGTYTVTITDGNNCSFVQSYVVDNFATSGCVEIDSLWVNGLKTNQVKLRWTTDVNAYQYQIRGRISGGGTWKYLNTTPSDQSEKKVTGLSAGITYEWQIRKFCDSAFTSSSPWSYSHFFTTLCDAPLNVFTDNINNTSAKLNWQSVPGVFGYEIRGRKQSGPWVTLSVNNPNATSKNVNGLEGSSTYEWQVRAICDSTMSRASAFSDLITFTTPMSRIDPLESKFSLYVYPNPANDHIMIEWPAKWDESFNILLRDVTGIKHLERESIQSEKGKISLDINFLEAGVYIIELRSNTQMYSGRIIVQ